jgi:hypothetical protein
LVANAAATPAYPLKPRANGRYVVNSNSVPFLIIGDAPHSILANLSNSDAVTYLTDRGQRDSTRSGSSYCAIVTRLVTAMKGKPTTDVM